MSPTDADLLSHHSHFTSHFTRNLTDAFEGIVAQTDTLGVAVTDTLTGFRMEVATGPLQMVILAEVEAMVVGVLGVLGVTRCPS